jgi:hypothetical protein
MEAKIEISFKMFWILEALEAFFQQKNEDIRKSQKFFLFNPTKDRILFVVVE